MRRPRVSRKTAVALVLVLPSALLLLLVHTTYGRYRIEVPARLGAPGRSAAIAALRGALSGVRPPAVAGATPTAPVPAPKVDEPSLVAYRLESGGPALVTVWLDGLPLAKVEGRGPNAAAAIAAAAVAIGATPRLASLDAGQRERARLQVDLVVGRGPALRDPAVLGLFTLHPGLEGLGVVVQGRELLVGPDDLVRSGTLFAKRPVREIPELNLGLDWPAIGRKFATGAKIDDATWAGLDLEWFRIRVDGFVEQPPGHRTEPPPALTRGIPSPPPPPTAANLTAAALEGGRYLVRHLAASGRYVYEVHLLTGKRSDPDRNGSYSLPRHAGTTYFLSELYRATKQEFLREPIERAFGHLAKLVESGGCRGTTPEGRSYACVVDRGQKRATLGSTALTVVALAEYRRATGSPTYDALAKDLTEWMLWLQRADGTFAHVFDVPTKKIDWETQMLYFTGEATLALARMYEVFQDPRYLAATERALDYGTRWYDFFVGGFFYGEEHWTCISANAIWPALKHRRYLDYCLGYGDYLRRMQNIEGDRPDQGDLVGQYGFSPFIVANNTPAGSRTEAMISTYELAEHHGEHPEELRKQILRSVGYSLGQQVTAAGDYAYAPVADGLGAIPSSPLDRNVRIDYVQHVCSSMLRAAPIAAELEKSAVLPSKP